MESPTDPPTLAAMICANVRAARLARGWEQSDVAEKMSGLGFDWKQSTVANVEGKGRSRRVTIEEWLGLAEIFDVAAFQLLIPQEGDETLAITSQFSMEDNASLFATIIDERFLNKVISGAEATAWKMALRRVNKKMAANLTGIANAHQRVADQLRSNAEMVAKDPDYFEKELKAQL